MIYSGTPVIIQGYAEGATLYPLNEQQAVVIDAHFEHDRYILRLDKAVQAADGLADTVKLKACHMRAVSNESSNHEQAGPSTHMPVNHVDEWNWISSVVPERLRVTPGVEIPENESPVKHGDSVFGGKIIIAGGMKLPKKDVKSILEAISGKKSFISSYEPPVRPAPGLTFLVCFNDNANHSTTLQYGNADMFKAKNTNWSNCTRHDGGVETRYETLVIHSDPLLGNPTTKVQRTRYFLLGSQGRVQLVRYAGNYNATFFKAISEFPATNRLQLASAPQSLFHSSPKTGAVSAAMHWSSQGVGLSNQPAGSTMYSRSQFTAAGKRARAQAGGSDHLDKLEAMGSEIEQTTGHKWLQSTVMSEEFSYCAMMYHR